MNFMPESLKGYHCPDVECYYCPYIHTLCIVYSEEGQKKYKEWKAAVSSGIYKDYEDKQLTFEFYNFGEV